MSETDRDKLKTLLHHWAEHNDEHCVKFKEWAEKAKGLGEQKVHDDILGAVSQMDKANECLRSALEKLNA